MLSQIGKAGPEIANDVRGALNMDAIQGDIIRLLWERIRPMLQDLRRRGVPAARTWRTSPRETSG